MNKGFWDNLPKPCLVLAPMADVTDAAFRRLIAEYGKPDVMWTEFVSADGLALAPEEGQKKLLADLIYTDAERPIVAQFFTSKPEHMERAARLAVELGFDGVDINMGCPDRSIEKQGAGAAHMKDPENAQAVIRAAQKGVSGKIPVSVKTRLGYNKDELETWLPFILETAPAAVTIHARTRKEMSKVPARWERIAAAVQIRNKLAPKVLILGNGDVGDTTHACALAEETGADGIMFGRAIFGNPWLFSHSQECENVSIQEKLETMVRHTQLFEELLPHKNFAIMKKHYKAYIAGFVGAAELRHTLMKTNTAGEVEEVVDNFLADLPSGQ